MRYLKLTISNLLLLCSLYTFSILTYHGAKYHEIPTAGTFMLILMMILTGFGVVLCCLSYKKYRFWKFNIDICTTIYLFCVFMTGFLMPGAVNLQFTHISGFFPYLSGIVYRLGENAIGIYEIFLFIGTIIYGLTIGEHNQKNLQ